MSTLPVSLPASARPQFSSRDVAMAFVALVWGTNFVVLKSALTAFPPLAFNALRFGAAAIAMLIWVFAKEGAGPKLDGRTVVKLIALGLIGNTIYQVIFIIGLASTSAAHGGMIVAATPVLVALVSAVTGLEKIRKPLAAGIGLAVFGMLLVLSMRNASEVGASLFGDLLLLASSFCWSLYTVGVKTVDARLSPLRVTALTMASGAPGLLLVGAPELSSMAWGSVPISAWVTLAYATLFPLVLAYFIWNASIQYVGPARTAIYNCAIPVVAVFTGWAIFNEQPTVLQLMGAALVIAGVLIARRAPKLQPATA